MNEVKELPDFEYTFSLETSSKEVRDFLKTLGKTVAFDSIIRKDGAGMEIVWRSKNDEEPVEWNPDLASKDDFMGRFVVRAEDCQRGSKLKPKWHSLRNLNSFAHPDVSMLSRVHSWFWGMTPHSMQICPKRDVVLT